MKQSVKRKVGLTIKKNFIWVIVLLCMVAFFAIIEEVLENEIWRFDGGAYRLISSLISNPVTSVFMVITNLGGAIGIVTTTILILIFMKNKKYKFHIVFNLGTVIVLNQMVKYIVQRPRPIEHRIIDQAGYSFPSRTFNGKYGILWFFDYSNLSQFTKQIFKMGTLYRAYVSYFTNRHKPNLSWRTLCK